MLRSLLVIGLAACAGRGDRPEAGSAAHPAPTATADSSPAPTAPPPDADMFTRSSLPTPFDPRVTSVLDQPVPDDVVLAVAVIAGGPSPRINQRFAVTAGGLLFHVRHSGKGGDWQVPFDQPLPTKPSAQLTAGQVDGWLTRLDQAGFFDHPGYEANLRAQDGSYVIVWARHRGKLHAVVYQNVRPEPIAELAMLAEQALAARR